MNYKFSVLAIIALSSSIFFSACNETTNIGSGILDQDFLNTEFSDTVTLNTLTITGDSVITYYPFSSSNPHPGGFLFGNFVDPVFGRTNATIYSEINPSSVEIPTEDITVDSVILELPYYQAGIYGSVENPMDIQVYKLEENIYDTIIYSSEVRELGEQIGSATITPLFSADSFDIFFPNETQTDSLVNVKIKVPSHFRVPLNNSFGEEIMTFNPDTIYNYPDLFKERLKGIFIESTSEDQGMLAFDMLRNNTNSSLYSPSIRVFYTYQDTMHSNYAFPIYGEFGNAKFTNLEYDYSNAIVNEYIDNEENSGQYSFVQGGQGLTTKITIPYTEGFSDVSLLKAELELTVFYFDEDNQEDYPPVSDIVLSREEINSNMDTIKIVIDDVVYALENTNLEGIFGGSPIEGDAMSGIPYTYKMNITAHLNKLRDGAYINNDLYLTVFTRPQRPGRAVICGSEHPDYPAKINLYYSK
jgi:hypothetical protein